MGVIQGTHGGNIRGIVGSWEIKCKLLQPIGVLEGMDKKMEATIGIMLYGAIPAGLGVQRQPHYPHNTQTFVL